MKLSVVLLTGEKLQFNVNKDSCVIGRSPQCDVVIPHESMSRKHCLLEIKNGDIFVTDLASSNGVSIEGKKITPNSPVAYQSYFSLSFGAVQSVSITLDDVETTDTSSSVREATSPSISKMPKSSKTKTKTTFPLPPKTKTKSSQKKTVIITLVCLVLALTAYVFLGQDQAEIPPTPAQIYD